MFNSSKQKTMKKQTFEKETKAIFYKQIQSKNNKKILKKFKKKNPTDKHQK